MRSPCLGLSDPALPGNVLFLPTACSQSVHYPGFKAETLNIPVQALPPLGTLRLFLEHSPLPSRLQPVLKQRSLVCIVVFLLDRGDGESGLSLPFDLS